MIISSNCSISKQKEILTDNFTASWTNIVIMVTVTSMADRSDNFLSVDLH